MAEDGVLSHEKSYEGWKWTADANVLNKAFSGFKNVNLVYFTHQQFAVGSGLGASGYRPGYRRDTPQQWCSF